MMFKIMIDKILKIISMIMITLMKDTVFNQVDDVDMTSIPTMNLTHLDEEQCSFFHHLDFLADVK